MSSKNQIVVPSAARKALGLKPGERLLVNVRDDAVIEITSPNLSRPRDGSLAHDWDDEIYLSWDASSVVVLTK